MASETSNTVQITAYTPNGFRVYVNVDLVSASELDTLLEDKGYLSQSAGAKAGEDVETISHVSLRMKANDDGTNTPHIAFYVDNENYEFRWVHKYLNNDSDVKEFEAATGVIVSSMPVFPANSHPERKPDKMAYIVKLSSNIKVARKQVSKTVVENGESKVEKRNYFERYLVAGQAPQATEPPTPTGQMSEADKTIWNATVIEGTRGSFASADRQQAALAKASQDKKIGYHQTADEAILIIKTDTIPF